MKKIKPFSILLPGVLLLGSCANLPFIGAEDIPVQAAIDSNKPFSNDDYSQLLTEYVTDDGWVNYEGLQKIGEHWIATTLSWLPLPQILTKAGTRISNWHT